MDHPRLPHLTPLTPDEERALLLGDLARIDDIHAGRPVPRFPNEGHRRQLLGMLQNLEPESRPRLIRIYREYLELGRYSLPKWILDLQLSPGGTS